MEEEKTTKARGRRRQVVASLVVCVLVGIGLVAFWPGEREPEYNGKKLSEWIVYTEPGSALPTSPEAREAVRQIGEKAVPWLLKWVKYKSPRWRRRVNHIIGADPGIERAAAAWLAFQYLGTKAEAAIPELTHMANDPNSPFDYREPLYTLAYVGDGGFQPVLDVLKNANHPDRGAAALIIGTTAVWGTNRLQAVPVLIECLHAEDGQLVGNAATALGRIGLESELVVPELAKRLNDPRMSVRSMAIRSLGLFGKDSRSAVPSLVERLVDANQDVREAATNALQKIAPEALTNRVKDF